MEVAICVVLVSLLHNSLAAVSVSSTDLTVGSVVIGTVDFTADDNQICAVFNVDSGNDYQILVTHVEFGTNAASIPQDGNGLLARRFEKGNSQCCNPSKSDTVCVARSCPYSTFIAAHAFVQRYDASGAKIGQYQSAWANSAAPLQVAVSCSGDTTVGDGGDGGGGGGGCETTWSKSKVDDSDINSVTFIDLLGDGPNAWGWAVCLSTTGVYTVDIWAGAGKNDLIKGTKVGEMDISLSCDPGSCTASVEYNMANTCGDYILHEAHVEFTAGTDNISTKAPGSFKIKEEFSTPRATYFASATSYCGTPSCDLVPIYDPSITGVQVCVLAHGVACGAC